MFGNINIKNFSFVFLGRIITSITQGFFYLAMAFILPPSSYGELSYVIALAGTFSILFRFGTPYSVVIQLTKNNSLLANNVNLLGLLLASISSIILIFINPIAAILSFGISLFILNQHNYLGKQNYKAFVLNSFVKGSLILGLPFLLYFFFDIAGIILGMAIANIVCGFGFIKNIRFSENFMKNLKINFKNLTHNFGVDVSSNLVRVIDKLAIAPLLGFTFVGIYQLNLQVLTLMEILPISLHSYLLSNKSNEINFKKIILYVIPSSTGLVILAVVLFPFFIEIFYPKYALGVPSFQILSISLIPLTIMAFYNAKLQTLGSNYVGISALIRISSILTLIIFLGPTYGLIGLSLAFLISAIITCIFLIIIYHNKIKPFENNL